MCYLCGQRRNAAGFSLSTSVSLTEHYSVSVQPLSSEASTVQAFEVPIPWEPNQPIHYYYYYYYYYLCYHIYAGYLQIYT